MHVLQYTSVGVSMLSVLLMSPHDCLQQVMEKSRNAARVVKQMTDLFAEQPDVYKQATGKRSAVQRWIEGSSDMLVPLV